MKLALLISILLLSQGIWGSVLEMNDASSESVIEVYEEMQEEEQESSENGWIHEFEKESVGTEMDHLSRLNDKKLFTED